MANEIYHRSNWGNAVNDKYWADVYEKYSATNKMYIRSDYYENSNVTDKLMADIYPKPSILLTPTAYDNGSLHSVKPVKTLGTELVTPTDSTSNWINARGNSTLSVVGGKIRATITSGTTFGVSTAISTVIGKTYSIKSDGFKSNTNGDFLIRVSNVAVLSPAFYEERASNSQTISTNGTFVATATTTYVGLLATLQTVGDYIETGNVSVKEVIDADFDFTRGSSATRVNEKGLIEDVQILSGDLVQNGDFEQIGSEEVTNGNFATDSDWTKGTGWSISNGKAISDGTSGSHNLRQSGAVTVGKTYKITITVSDYVSGNVEVSAGAAPRGTMTANGTYTFYQYATPANSFYVIANSFVGSIDNVSVKEVGQNWTVTNDDTNNYVEFNQDEGTVRLKFLNTSPITALTSDAQYLSGKKYKLTVDVKEVVSGAIKIDAAGVSETFNSIGVQERIIEPSGNSNISFYRATADVDITLNSVSLIEITDDTDLPRINYTNFDYEDVLGDELVTNGSFSDGTNNWTPNTNAILSVENGRLKVAISGAGSGYPSQHITTEVGKLYKVTADAFIGTSSRLALYNNANGQFNNLYADGSFDFTFVATSTSTQLRLYVYDDGAYGLWDNVNVKEFTEDVVVPYSGEGSLLLEPQSTNLITYSEDFSQSNWQKYQISLNSNNTISPDGTQNASKITINSSTPSLGDTSLSLTVGDTYTLSCFVKKGTNRWVRLASVSSGSLGAWFDLENNVVGTVNSTSASIENYGNGWYRISNTITAISGTNQTFLGLSDADGGTSSTQVGNTVFAWGFQVEQGTYATSYIPTNGSTVTRLADVCNNAGSSDLISSTSGVLYAEISALANYNLNRLISLSNGTTSNVVKIGFLSSATNYTIFSEVRSGAVLSAYMTYNFGAVTPKITKIAIRYKENNFSLYVDGVERATDTSGSVPTTLDKLSFDRGDGANDFEGNVKCVAVFDYLDNDQLERLTGEGYETFKLLAQANNYTII